MDQSADPQVLPKQISSDVNPHFIGEISGDLDRFVF
jgi:hypothetical protein